MLTLVAISCNDHMSFKSDHFQTQPDEYHLTESQNGGHVDIGEQWHAVLHSDEYRGELDVMFKNSNKIRLRDGNLFMLTDDKGLSTTPALAVFMSQCQALSAVIRRGSTTSESRMDALRQKYITLYKNTSKKRTFLDWNNHYIVDIANATDAEKILSTLFDSNLIKWAYPHVKTHELGWVGADPMPGISVSQKMIKIGPDDPTPNLFPFQ